MHRKSVPFHGENMQRWNIASSIFLRNRSEKPEQVHDPLVKLDQRIESIKVVCQTVGKKLLNCLQLHGIEKDKRLKKLPESALSKQLLESSNQFDEKESIRQTLITCGNVEGELANMHMSYEDNVEQSVLQPLQALLERDIPVIIKLRKQVAKQAQEVDSLKPRTRQTVLVDRPAEGAKKANQALEELEEAANKLELYKDQLATEMYNFYAREEELSKIFTCLIESQLRYHSDATVALQKVLPEIKSIEQCAQRPVFGCSLEDHFRLTKQPIASVISESITALLKEGLEQEGLFRIAGGATKLKKLKAAFDAGMVDMEEFITDPHCIASALKLYLRELPEPLLTFDLYDDWADASQLPPEQRLNTIALILRKMKPLYFENLKYLIQFLARLADNAEVNKMSPTNLAIVVGPNLLWSRNGDGQNILTTGVQSSIAESMISNATMLFGDDSELGEMTSQVVSPSQPPGGGSRPHSRDVDNSIAMQQTTIAKVDSSDSLSSDSLGTDSAVGTNQSSVSGSEVSSLSKSVETPDVSTLVAPKRGAKKPQAPLPPGTEATVQVAKVTTASVVTKAPATSGNQDVPTTHQKVAVTTTRATVIVATEETSGDWEDKNKTTRVAVTTTQVKATITPEETEPLRKSPAPERSNPVTVETGDEKTQPVAKRSTKFAANQALISNVLSGPRKTLLSRPNTVYMENAKVELVKTAEEQYRDETTRSEMNGAGNSLGKTVEEDGVPDASLPAVQQKKKPPSVAEESGSQKKSARKAEPSVSEMYAAANEIGNLDSDEEIRSPSPQGPRRSGGADTPEDQLPKKPERPSKPVRPTQGGDTAEAGNRSSSGYKASAEDHSGKKEASIVESSSTAKPHGESTGGTQSSSLGKQPKQPPPEVPQVVPQQPASGGSGVRPPKPPPPRLTSDSAIEEDTYL